MTPRSRRDAWFRVTALFALDLLFLTAGLLALRGDLIGLAVVIVVGAALAIVFNLVLLVRSRTTEATWAPGSGGRQLRSSFEFLGLAPAVPVGMWKGLGAVAVIVNLVALVVAA